MKTIILTKGMVALVDDKDFEYLNQWKWYASHSRYGNFYAKRDEFVNGVRRRVYMHRLVSGAVKGQYVDHINHITLDNQSGNLRKGSQTENMANVLVQKNNKSGFKGVAWDESKKKWIVQSRLSPKTFIGRFNTALEGAIAYDNAVLKSFGSKAVTNKKMGLYD